MTLCQKVQQATAEIGVDFAFARISSIVSATRPKSSSESNSAPPSDVARTEHGRLASIPGMGHAAASRRLARVEEVPTSMARMTASAIDRSEEHTSALQ